jgi:thioredoxin reductase (NADPH)
VFAIGDARANSVKRVASAVGEGAVCIQQVHSALIVPLWVLGLVDWGG